MESLLSGTLIIPILGSMVQKGKLALCALTLDKQLNKVDLPTFGRPTIPAFINKFNYELGCNIFCFLSKTFSASILFSSVTQQSTGQTAAHCGSS